MIRRLPSRARDRYLRAGRKNILALVRAARESFVVVAGGLEAGIWAHPRVVRELFGAAARGVSFRIVVGPQADPVSLNALASIGLEVYMLSTHPLLHFAIADSLHVRYEGDHHAGGPTPANVVSYNNEAVARVLLEFADNMCNEKETPDREP